ncbi:MAG: HAD family hydrolase [Hyphomicrobiales bacterium]|nr:HAD family hydrolase [Hyphomicrobiales bacterium]
MQTMELIIFDCDGVLVDSEPLSMQVLLETIADAGTIIDPAQGYERFLGKSLASVTETLRREYRIDVTDDALETMRKRLYALFEEELQPIPGIANALDNIELQCCVASSSQPERIELSLSLTGLLPFFDNRIFSASMVKNGKPAPDLFLLAAQQMQVDPGRCIVIEDSPAGVEAAMRAGMRVFGFLGGSHAQSAEHRQTLEDLKPSLTFDDMAALPGLIARVGQ